MSKIMILSVAGVELPFKRLVSVDDEEEFLGGIVGATVKDVIGSISALETTLSKELLMVKALKKLRVTLTDTGLTEYPTSEEEIKAALNEEVLV